MHIEKRDEYYPYAIYDAFHAKILCTPSELKLLKKLIDAEIEQMGDNKKEKK